MISKTGVTGPATIRINDIFGNPSFAALGMPSLCYQTDAIVPIHSVVSTDKGKVINTGSTNVLAHAVVVASFERLLRTVSGYGANIRPVFNGILEAYTGYNADPGAQGAAAQLESALGSIRRTYRGAYGEDTVARGLRNSSVRWVQSGLAYDSYWQGVALQVDVIKANIAGMAATGSCDASPTGIVFPYVSVGEGSQSEGAALLFTPPKSQVAGVATRAPITMSELRRLSKVYKGEIVGLVKMLYGEGRTQGASAGAGTDVLASISAAEPEDKAEKSGVLFALSKLYAAADRVSLLLRLALNAVDPNGAKASKQPVWPGGSAVDRSAEFVAAQYTEIGNLLHTLKLAFNYINGAVRAHFEGFDDFVRLGKTAGNTFEPIVEQAGRLVAGEGSGTRAAFLAKLKDYTVYIAKTVGAIVEEDEAMMRGTKARWASYRERHEKLSREVEELDRRTGELYEAQYVAKTAFLDSAKRLLSAMSFVLNRCICAQEEMFKQPMLLKMSKDEEGEGAVGERAAGGSVVERDPRFKKAISALLDMMLKSDNPKLAALREKARDYAAKNRLASGEGGDPFEEEEEMEDEASEREEYDYMSISKAKENEVISDIMREKAELLSGIDGDAETLRTELEAVHREQDGSLEGLPEAREIQEQLAELREEEARVLEGVIGDINGNVVASIDERIKNSTLHEELSRLNDRNMRNEIMRNTDLSDEIRRIEKTADAQNAVELREFDEEAEAAKKQVIQQLRTEFKKQQEVVPNAELGSIVRSQEQQLETVRTKIEDEIGEQRRLLLEKLNARKSILVSEAKIRHGNNELDLKLQQNDANVNREVSEIIIKHHEARVQNERKLLEEYMAGVRDAEADLRRDLRNKKGSALDRCKKLLGRLRTDLGEKRAKYELEEKMALDAKLENWKGLKEQHAAEISKSLSSSVKKETDAISKAKAAEAELNERMKFEKEQVARIGETYKMLSKKFAVAAARAEGGEAAKLCKDYVGTVDKLAEELKTSEQAQRDELQKRLLRRKQGGKAQGDQTAPGSAAGPGEEREEESPTAAQQQATASAQGQDATASIDSGLEGFPNLTFDVNASYRLGASLADGLNTSAVQKPGKAKSVEEELVGKTKQVYGNVRAMVDDMEAKIYEIDPRPILVEAAKTGSTVDVDGILERQLNAVANLKTAFKMDEDEQRRQLEERMRRKMKQRSENQTKRIALMEQAADIEENNKLEEEKLADVMARAKDQSADAGSRKHRRRGDPGAVSVDDMEIAIEERNMAELSSLQSQYEVELKKAAIDCEEAVRDKYEGQIAQLRREQAAEIQSLFERVGARIDELTGGRMDAKKLGEIDLEGVDFEYLEMVRKHKRALGQLETAMERDIRDEKERRSQELARTHVQAKSELIKKQIGEKTRVLGELFPKLFNSEDKIIQQRKRDTDALKKRLEDEKREMEQKINEEIRKIGEENAKKIEEERRRIEAEFDDMLRQEVMKAKGDRAAIEEIKSKVLNEGGTGAAKTPGALSHSASQAGGAQLEYSIPSLDDLSEALKSSVSAQLSAQTQQLQKRIEEMRLRKQRRLEEMKSRMDGEMNKQINAKQEEKKLIQEKTTAQLGEDSALLQHGESALALRPQGPDMDTTANNADADDEAHSTATQSDSGDIVEEPAGESDVGLSDQKELILQKVDGRVTALNELITQLREFNGKGAKGAARGERYVDDFDETIRNEGVLSVAKPGALTKEESEGLRLAQRIADGFHGLGLLPGKLTVQAATHLPETDYARLGNAFCRSFYYEAQGGGAGTLYVRTERLGSPILPAIMSRCVAHIRLGDWSDESPAFQREFNRCTAMLRRATGAV